MGNLLPDRHPNKDFFVLDVKSAAPKDDLASMEHPIFSLSVKPDMRELEYDYRGNKITIVPSGRGLATIMDKDIIMYAISKLTHGINQGWIDPDKEESKWIEVSAHEVMVGCNWNTGKRDYKRFEDALIRLRGTTIVTNIETGKSKQTEGFGIIDRFTVIRKDEEGEEGAFGRMSRIRLKVSDWTWAAVKAGEVLSISGDYFRLRRPVERRLYEIARKHCGEDKKKFEIWLANLQAKVGSKVDPNRANLSLNKFRFVLHEVIKDDNIPDYIFELVDDKVTIRPRRIKKKMANIKVREETLERARKLASDKGYDFYALEREWRDFIAKVGTPNNPDGALIGFIKQKKSLRQKRLF